MRLSHSALRELSRSEKSFSYDLRPVSGNVGQCDVGFVTLPSGKLVRVIEEPRGPEFIGPGTYSPQNPKPSHSVKLSRHRRKIEYDKPASFAGPVDHATLPRSTKLQHKISGGRSNEEAKPFLSGTLGHRTWVENVYESSWSKADGERSVFHQKDVNDLMYNLFTKEVEDNHAISKQSAVFKSKVPRLPKSSTGVPGPCRYNIPSTFGDGRKTSFGTIWKRDDFEEPEITPGPGEHEPAKLDPGPRLAFPRQRIREKNSGRPGPGQYDINMSALDTRLKPKLGGMGRRSASWVSLTDTPPPGTYEVVPKWADKTKIGLMKSGGHKDIISRRMATEEDHEFGFSTLHADFMKPSVNHRYKTIT